MLTDLLSLTGAEISALAEAGTVRSGKPQQAGESLR